MLISRLLTGCMLAVAVAGCAAAPAQPLAQAAGEKKPVYIVSHNGWHTGIVVSANDVAPELAFLEHYFENAAWYEIGWGDKQFYKADKATAGIALRAGLVPTETVLHVTALPERPDHYFSGNRVIELHIDAADHVRLVKAIAGYFQYSNEDNVMPLDRGLYGDSLFFDATGQFHIFNTCNTWTARMLAQAGVPVSTFMTLRANSVMKQLESIAVSDTGKR